MVLMCVLPPQRAAAESILRRLQEHPDAWTRVDAVLEGAKSQQSKYFALQVGVGGCAASQPAPILLHLPLPPHA